MLVLKYLILNSLYFGRCGGIERTDFKQFLLLKCVEVGVVVLKELILNSFYCWWCGGFDRTDFEQFVLLDSAVVMKELILNSFYFGRV